MQKLNYIIFIKFTCNRNYIRIFLFSFQTLGNLYDKETGCFQGADPGPKGTENPAYGLSSKNWLALEDSEDDGRSMLESLNMESSGNVEQQKDESDSSDDEELLTNNLLGISPSQQGKDCDLDTEVKMKRVSHQSHFQQTRMELKTNSVEEGKETTKHDLHGSDMKHSKLTWSVLRHRQLNSDTFKNCDSKGSKATEQPSSDKIHSVENHDKSGSSSFMSKTKKSIKDKAFPLSLMRPITKISEKSQNSGQLLKKDLSRQQLAQQNTSCGTSKREMENSTKLTNDLLGLNSNPLSDIAKIKTEESIQEWLARIGESADNTPDETMEKDMKVKMPPQPPPRRSVEQKDKDCVQHKALNFHCDRKDALSKKHSHHSSETPTENSIYDDLTPKTEEPDTIGALSSASKVAPANIPMVVMQCSRIHSHIGCKPPFQQTSLPMGTLVTALYQESDWLYIQTPHGVEGFVLSSNCVPIGTINEPVHASRRPWEPCDFPIQISKKQEFGRSQESYIPATLPTNSGKQAAPYVKTVKMKTNFYNDRYFSHTFKSKDSIKTAKTVTDILRSSPETKVSNQ